MKLKEFLKLQKRKNILEKNLIDTTGGSDITINDLWQKIYYKIEEFLAVESEEAEIKEMVIRTIRQYELRTPKIEKNTRALMEKMGFDFLDD